MPNGFIVASNLPGAVAAFAFVAIALPLIPTEDAAARRSVTLVLAGGAAGLLTLWTYLVFAKVDHDRLVFLLGAFASGICLCRNPISPAGTAQADLAMVILTVCPGLPWPFSLVHVYMCMCMHMCMCMLYMCMCMCML